MGDVLDKDGGRLPLHPGETLTGRHIAQMPPAVRAEFAELLANDWRASQLSAQLVLFTPRSVFPPCRRRVLRPWS